MQTMARKLIDSFGETTRRGFEASQRFWDMFCGPKQEAGYSTTTT
jgi:hypothetical protein